MNISFIKMHGAGNDYVYIDLIENNYNVDFSDLSKKISSRHFGVGSDGLILILNSNIADFRMQMFNANGSEAEMCGNAIRCVGKYLYDNKYLKKDEFQIETLSGIKTLFITEKNGFEKVKKIKVDMGEPFLNGKDIPVNICNEPVVGIDIMGYKATCVGMGNPHCIIFVDEITDEHVLNEGPKIELNPIFPNNTNVEFVKIIDKKNIEMRVWERGSGETLACGTGACASAVASILNNFTLDKINVKLPGGTLEIEWNKNSNRVYLTGPAEVVFNGVYYYNPE